METQKKSKEENRKKFLKEFEELANRRKFIKVPNRLIKDTKLTDSAKWNYKILMAHRNDKTALCCPSQDKVAIISGLTRTQCNRAIKELEENGYLAITKAHRGNGQYANHKYTFIDNLDEKFTIVKTAVMLTMLQKGLTHKHVIFYMGLRRFANDKKNYVEDITRKTIALKIGLTVKTVVAYLNALNKIKIIEVTESIAYCNCWNIKMIYDIELDNWEAI